MTAELQERIIAGGMPDDLMTVRHLMIRGSQLEIGEVLGKLAAQRYGGVAPPSRDRLYTGVNRRYLADVWPAHHQRMLGVARALGVDPEDDGIELQELYYSPGSPVPGCSNLYYPETAGGQAVLSRNYDFSTGVDPVSTREPYLMEIHPEAGYSYLCMCAYDLLGGATDGMNSEGLAVALLADHETGLPLTDPDAARGIFDLEGTMYGSRPGVGVGEIQVVRYLLETCRNAMEARRALLTLISHYRGIPLHYIVGDRNGDGFVFEGRMQGHLPRFNESNGAPLAVTNHPIREHELTDHPTIRESVSRLERLNSRLTRPVAEYDAAFLRETARSVAATEPVGEGQYVSDMPGRTLWHALYDLESRRLDIDYYLHDRPDGSIARSPEFEFVLGE